LGKTLETAFDTARRATSARAVVGRRAQLHRVARQNLWGMWPHFIAFGLLSALAAGLGHASWHLYSTLPLPLLRGLAWLTQPWRPSPRAWRCAALTASAPPSMPASPRRSRSPC